MRPPRHAGLVNKAPCKPADVYSRFAYPHFQSIVERFFPWMSHDFRSLPAPQISCLRLQGAPLDLKPLQAPKTSLSFETA